MKDRWCTIWQKCLFIVLIIGRWNHLPCENNKVLVMKRLLLTKLIIQGNFSLVFVDQVMIILNVLNMLCSVHSLNTWIFLWKGKFVGKFSLNWNINLWTFSHSSSIRALTVEFSSLFSQYWSDDSGTFNFVFKFKPRFHENLYISFMPNKHAPFDVVRRLNVLKLRKAQ